MRWFISDTHFYHKNILSEKKAYHRPFQSLDEMHNCIISNWNKKVRPNDIIYIVGDFSFGTKAQTKLILSQLNGRKRLILGNHCQDRFNTVRGWLDAGMDDVRDELIIYIGGNPVLLKHYPYAYSGLKLFWTRLLQYLKLRAQPRKYISLFPRNMGMWHIHGHVHGGKNVKKQINVSCESLNYTPINENEILEIINGK